MYRIVTTAASLVLFVNAAQAEVLMAPLCSGTCITGPQNQQQPQQLPSCYDYQRLEIRSGQYVCVERERHRK